MQSSLIGKIEKAKRYAEQPDRVCMLGFVATFKGDNNEYTVSLDNAKWRCNCNFFSQAGTCSHTMAIQKMLGAMLPPEAKSTPVI
jgi:hypothetical protein